MKNLSSIAVTGLLTAFGVAAATPASAQYHHRPQVRCESHHDGQRRTFCPLPTRFGVHVVQQISRMPCIQGRNWFVAPGGVSVRGGCRAVFAANGHGGFPRPPYGHRPYPQPRPY